MYKNKIRGNFSVTKNSVKNTRIGQQMLDGTIGVKNACFISALIRVLSRTEYAQVLDVVKADAIKNSRYNNANVTEEMREDVSKYQTETELKAFIYQAKQELRELKKNKVA